MCCLAVMWPVSACRDLGYGCQQDPGCRHPHGRQLPHVPVTPSLPPAPSSLARRPAERRGTVPCSTVRHRQRRPERLYPGAQQRPRRAEAEGVLTGPGGPSRAPRRYRRVAVQCRLSRGGLNEGLVRVIGTGGVQVQPCRHGSGHTVPRPAGQRPTRRAFRAGGVEGLAARGRVRRTSDPKRLFSTGPRSHSCHDGLASGREGGLRAEAGRQPRRPQVLLGRPWIAARPGDRELLSAVASRRRSLLGRALGRASEACGRVLCGAVVRFRGGRVNPKLRLCGRRAWKNRLCLRRPSDWVSNRHPVRPSPTLAAAPALLSGPQVPLAVAPPSALWFVAPPVDRASSVRGH